MKKKVLVTGAGGFIASHLCEYLIAKGYSVRGLVRYNSRAQAGWLEHSPYKNDLELVQGDVCSFQSVLAAAQGCEQIYHLAALISIPYSYKQPLDYIKVNVEGTYNVLQTALTLSMPVMLTSSSEVYGTALYVPIDEKHPLQPQSPYSATKISSEMIGMSFHYSYGLPVTIVRPFNTYGPRQSARAIIPAIATQLLSGAKTIKLGNLSPRRDFCFVKDTVAGMYAIASSPDCIGQATNIASGKDISIGELVTLLCELCKWTPEIVQEKERLRPEKSEVMRLLGSAQALQERCHVTPQTTLRDGLTETIKWLQTSLSAYAPASYAV